jgi:hypothetical protein
MRRRRHSRTNNVEEKKMEVIQMIDRTHIRPVAELFHSEWRDVDEDYRTIESAMAQVAARLSDPAAPVFLALGDDGALAGVGGVALSTSAFHDDYYRGFMRENSISPCDVGRDIVTAKEFRGQVFRNRKVWEHVLVEMVGWLDLQSKKSMRVILERGGSIDLVEMNAKRGARMVRPHLRHRDKGFAMCMMEYDVADTIRLFRGS